jgi:UDPglucose 6-dehydrogenase
MQKSVSFIGLGYVGLCSAICYADKGFKTFGFDIDEEKINSLRKGKMPFFEPNSQTLLSNALKQNLVLTKDVYEAVECSDFSFITVGTPTTPEGKIDLRSIRTVAKAIGKALKDKNTYHVVVVKSTILPGTTENTVKPLLVQNSGKSCGVNFGLCVNPEFLREGSAIQDIHNPDRIVVGELDQRSGDALVSLYKDFYNNSIKIIRTNLSNAELIKYANNSFLTTKISFINTIADICEKVPGADITTIAKIIGLDHRISQHYLRAGLGYGGSCLPKDLKALISFTKESGCNSNFLESIKAANDNRSLQAVGMIKENIGSLLDKRIAVLGLSFKPNTDDMRDAVSIKIIKRLLREGAKVSIYDPMALNNARNIFSEAVTYAHSVFACLEGTDCCIITTGWDEFKLLKPEDFTSRMRLAALVDGRRITDPSMFRNKMIYKAIGLGP